MQKICVQLFAYITYIGFHILPPLAQKSVNYSGSTSEFFELRIRNLSTFSIFGKVVIVTTVLIKSKLHNSQVS